MEQTMLDDDNLPVAELAVPGCPGCVRLVKRVEKLEIAVRELREQVLKLQARLNRNSSNSSKPPSSDPPSSPPRTNKAPSGRKPGGQPGHEPHRCERQPKQCVARTVEYWPDHCDKCDRTFSAKAEAGDPESHWHQVWEIPSISAELVEHLAHGRSCACGHVTWAKIPAAIGRSIVGPNLAAILTYMVGRCHESKRLVQEFAVAVFGVRLSLGTISNLEREMQDALKPGYDEAMAAVRAAETKNVDETGWYEKSRLCWLWTAATKTVAVFQIHAKRGQEGLKAFLGEVVQGIVSSDRWGGYARLPLHWRQICWAHLKRDFQKLVDSGNAAALKTGRAGLCVVNELFVIWHGYKEGKFGRRTLRNRMEPVKARLRRILSRGRDGPDPATARFCKRILKLGAALWTFIEHEGVEPTNNHAERVLRPAVLWRKRSFGNHSADGCRFAERILTVTQTLRLQGRPVLDYLRDAIIAHRSGNMPPSLVSTAL
jgi:transposase